MASERGDSARQGVHTLRDYLDMQAQVGITKHMGGFAATDELLARCHIDTAREILYVGSGIGVGPASIARRCGRQPIRCHAS